MAINFTPRPSQEQILRYRGGRLGIAAVPGAGKTQILSALAAQIIASGSLGSDQEVLIVTLVNSAVDNFESRIKRFFDNPLQALYRYRVRTLHGLAHDIVREKPGRVGLVGGLGSSISGEPAFSGVGRARAGRRVTLTSLTNNPTRTLSCTKEIGVV